MLIAPLAALVLQATPQIALHTSRFSAEYGYLRSLAENKERADNPALEMAVLELGDLESTFPPRITTRAGAKLDATKDGAARVRDLYWRTLDALVFSSGSVEQLGSIADVMPKIGGELDTSVVMKKLADILTSAREEYDRTEWPAAKSASETAIKDFSGLAPARQEHALQFILSTAGIGQPPAKVHIQIIPRMAGKEGMTVRSPSGPLVVIGLGKYRGADFDEVVLHESTHVFDAASPTSLFAKLRTALKAANRPDFEIEQVPHVTMFLLAAESVRRNIDASHKDVGITFGAYARGLEPLRKVVEPELRRLIDGKETADAFVSAVVSKLGP